jgi:phosphonate transport system substrate-binding protein
MISPQETVVHYHQLLEYLAGNMDKSVQLVQRRTYGEMNKLIGAGKIDLAFICSGPYATGKDIYGFEALAVPKIRGTHLYRSYLIIRKDSPYNQLSDLRGKVFAFTDPDSNTGKLVPTYWLSQHGETPKHFFDRTIYTHSHDNSIMAVATDLVDAATVHEQIWEFYNNRDPVYTSQTRIIKKSISFGNPLMVASSRLPDPLKERIRHLLIAMHRNKEGQKILSELMIDRFVLPKEEWYRPIMAMQKKCN